MAENREIEYEIVEKIGVITKNKTGWTKEINLISWNGQPPKYDIRDWTDDHSRMSRGITLHEDEMDRIRELLRDRDRTREMKRDMER